MVLLPTPPFWLLTATNNGFFFITEDVYKRQDTVIAYWDLVPKGGTFYTVNKALESGKSVINLSLIHI